MNYPVKRLRVILHEGRFVGMTSSLLPLRSQATGLSNGSRPPLIAALSRRVPAAGAERDRAPPLEHRAPPLPVTGPGRRPSVPRVGARGPSRAQVRPGNRGAICGRCRLVMGLALWTCV